jgi:putative ABC transport system permease protein
VREVWRRIEAWLRRQSLDRDLEDELRFHLDMKARETGSRAQATRALGSALPAREIAREAWGWRWLDDVLWDIRYALRRFRQNPGFTAVAITMLALGIGLNSAVFTVTNAVLFKGFRLIDRNDRILYIHNQKNGQYSGVSYPDFRDWRTQARSFDGMGAVLSSQVTLTDQSGLVESHIANRDLLDYTMDYRVHAYLMAISLGAGFLFGLVPALRVWTVDFNTALKDGSRGATAGARSKRVSSLLVIGEMALAIVLLAGAGVIMRSFLNLAIAPFGISVARTLTMELNLPEVEYSHPEARVAFFDRLKTHLDAIPGVESTSIGTDVPWGGAARRPYELAGAAPVDEQSRPTIPAMTIGPDYFRTLGATVLSGREFNDFDNAAGSPAVIVNERFASQHWPGQNAVGQRLRLFNGQTSDAWLTVVGVASNIATYRANVSQPVPSRPEITPLVYLPYRQGPRAAMWVIVRTPLSSAELVSAFRREISTLDPHLPIWLGPFPLAQWLTRGPYGNIRNQTVLFLIFAVMALLLASVGLYAVVAHSVSQRTQEIGIRTAMGAMARDILALVFRQGMLPVGVGLAIGLAGAVAVTPVLKSLLVGVAPTDSVTLIIASATLIVSAMLGCWIPARLALRVDPVVALRHE